MNSVSQHGYNDNRGQKCVNELIVHRDGTYEVHGVLQDGREIEYKVGGKDGDPFVGRQLKSDERWIKAKYKGQDKYLAVKGEGFKLTTFDMTGEELRNEQFVEPDVPFREVRKLYEIKRPSLAVMGPRTELNQDEKISGDIVEEYWCGRLIRKQSLVKIQDNILNTIIVPIPIPKEILRGTWEFQKSKESYAWKQTGEWGIYHEEWFNKILNDLFVKLKILAS
jgi:hypothetical protein